MAPSSSAVGLRWPSTTSASVSVGSRAAAAVAGRARIGAGALRPDLEHAAQLHRGDAAAAGADGLDVDRAGPQRMARHRHLRLEQRLSPGSTAMSELVPPVSKVMRFSMPLTSPRWRPPITPATGPDITVWIGVRYEHAGAGRAAVRLHHQRARSAESAAATALRARADSATPAARYRRWRRSRRCARIRAIPDSPRATATRRGPGAMLADDRRRCLLVRRIGVGEQEAHGDRLDAVGHELARGAARRRRASSGSTTSPRAIEPLARPRGCGRASAAFSAPARRC